MIAVMNTDLLAWDSKMSYPWILKIEISYDGSRSQGMPDKKTSEVMDAFEDELDQALTPANGALNVGRETAEGVRTIYIACKDFRASSKAASQAVDNYSGRLNADYDIYKDKYWRTFDRFSVG